MADPVEDILKKKAAAERKKRGLTVTLSPGNAPDNPLHHRVSIEHGGKRPDFKLITSDRPV